MQTWDQGFDYDDLLTPIEFQDGFGMQPAYESSFDVDTRTPQYEHSQVEQWMPDATEESPPADQDSAIATEYVCYGTVSFSCVT